MNARAAQKCPAAARSPLWALLATLEKYLAASAYWRLRKAERPAPQLAIADHSPPSPAAFCASPSARRSSPALYQAPAIDRKSVVSGKSVSVRVDLGGRRIIKKKKNT